MEESIAKVKLTENSLIIEISKEDLFFIANSHPHGYIITNKEDFFDYIEKNLIHFNEGEDGCTQFYRIFDDLIEVAYEDGEEFVKNPEFDDDDWDE